jgi:hypothetical protein
VQMISDPSRSLDEPRGGRWFCPSLGFPTTPRTQRARQLTWRACSWGRYRCGVGGRRADPPRSLGEREGWWRWKWLGRYGRWWGKGHVTSHSRLRKRNGGAGAGSPSARDCAMEVEEVGPGHPRLAIARGRWRWRWWGRVCAREVVGPGQPRLAIARGRRWRWWWRWCGVDAASLPCSLQCS